MNLISSILINILLIGSLFGLPGYCEAGEERDHEEDFIKSYVYKWMPEGGSFLGVHIDDVDADMVRDLDLKREYGVHVAKVIEGTAAEKAGLKKDDVIIGWNDRRVESATQLRRLVKETPAGRKVRLHLIRDGREQNTEVIMGEHSKKDLELKFMEPFKDDTFKESWKEYTKQIPETLDKYIWHDKEGSIIIGGHKLDDLGKEIKKELFICKGRGRMGVMLQSLTPQLADYFGLEREGGALITSVRKDSPAEKAGLKAGDVILSIDGEDIDDPHDVVEIVREKEEGTLSVTIMRDKNQESFEVTLEEEEDLKKHFEESTINL